MWSAFCICVEWRDDTSRLQASGAEAPLVRVAGAGGAYFQTMGIELLRVATSSGWRKNAAGAVILFSVLPAVSGMADNVLKPLILGRGADAPMPVILLGALGGMAAGGILGMFVGATLLALGYQFFMGWVSRNAEVVIRGEG